MVRQVSGKKASAAIQADNKPPTPEEEELITTTIDHADQRQRKEFQFGEKKGSGALFTVPRCFNGHDCFLVLQALRGGALPSPY